MGGENWHTPFPDLKAGHVDHLLSYNYNEGLLIGLFFEEIL